ncbi:MAG TPA: GNAT family protein [Ktedonobacterales bacterium]|jgi:RimJ/RimL family protein N-acetyltransferase
MLQGEKIILRAVKREDLQRRYEFANDLSFHLLISNDPWEPVPFERLEHQFDDQMEQSDPGEPSFAIEADGQYIGHCLLYDLNRSARTCQLGIGIGDPAYRGRGYGRDALRLLLDYAFRIQHMHKVALTVDADDQRAIRAYRACGFIEEGRQRQQAWGNGKYLDLLHMGILREEWEAGG